MKKLFAKWTPWSDARWMLMRGEEISYYQAELVLRDACKEGELETYTPDVELTKNDIYLVRTANYPFIDESEGTY